MSVSALQQLRAKYDEIQAKLPTNLEEELKAYVLQLREDPTPDDFTEMLSKVQGYRDRVSALLLGVIRATADASRVCERVEAMYHAYLQQELVRPYILGDTSLKNADQREGAAIQHNPILGEIHGFLLDAAELLTYVKSLKDICSVAHENLESTNQNLSRQISVVSQQLELLVGDRNIRLRKE